MSIHTEKLKQEIEQLALAEKLLLVEDLWDSIAQNASQLPVPLWQQQELDARWASFQEHPPQLQEWESVHAQLRERKT